MARTMPTTCVHGYILDWGDFGCDACGRGEHCPGGPHSEPEHCPHGCGEPGQAQR